MSVWKVAIRFFVLQTLSFEKAAVRHHRYKETFSDAKCLINKQKTTFDKVLILFLYKKRLVYS